MQCPSPVLTAQARIQADYDLRFDSLFQVGRALSFPCDAEGHVPMDRLSDKELNNYLFARAMVGRDFATPVVLVHLQ